MKKRITVFSVAFLAIFNLNAQDDLDSLTYKNTQDINFFSKVKNNTMVIKYQTESGNIIKVGDTVVLGNPTSQEFLTRTKSLNYGTKLSGGISNSRSVEKKTYEFVKMGRPAGFGSIMTALNGDAEVMASNSLKNTTAIVKEIKAYHRGSKKKPLYLVMVLGEVNDRAFGINKYLSVMDTELALESGEVLLKNRKMTREEAILKLKEAKELMEIEMMTKEEFEILKKELAPIIKGKN
jgi:hypothetical protein